MPQAEGHEHAWVIGFDTMHPSMAKYTAQDAIDVVLNQLIIQTAMLNQKNQYTTYITDRKHKNPKPCWFAQGFDV